MLALTPQPNEAFMREVDDAVRQDRLIGFWRRYGRLAVGAVIVALVVFAGWLWWSHHSAQQSGLASEKMNKVLQAIAGGGAPDAKALDALTRAGQPGYRASALLAKAAVAAQKNDGKGAAAIYAAMAADTSLAQPYRDLGLVRQTAIQFDTMKPQQIVDRLKPLAVAGDPWFGSAGEMSALAYMKMDKPQLAGPIFAAMVKDDKVPATIRSRARQMAALLGIDVVDAEGDANGGQAGGQ